MTPLLQNFIIESREIIENATRLLLELEAAPNDKEIVNELFRGVHTVKGASGIIENIVPFTELAHSMEDLMQKVRDGVEFLDSGRIDLLLGCCDQFLLWVDELELQESLSENADGISQQMRQQLQSLYSVDVAQVAASIEDSSLEEKSLSWLADTLGHDNFNDVEELQDITNGLILVYTPNKQCFFSGDDPLAWMCSLPNVIWSKVLFIPDTEPFDIYQAQLQFYVITTAEAAELKQLLLPISEQYQLYQLQQAPETQPNPDQRVQYVQKIAHHQINLLTQHQENEQIREGTVRSVSHIYQALSQQISDRPAPLPENATDSDLIGLFERVLQSFDEQKAVIDADENTAVIAPQSNTAVEEQLDKVRKKQIKTLKVDQDKVDLLMDLVGELIVAKNSMQYLAYRAENEFGVRKLAQDIKAEQSVISRLAEDLQSVVMQVRMVPLATVFQRYPRLIRDISRKLGKQVDLIIEGEDTEADKSIVEDLSEPLVHLIRNSLDHGIESPELRRNRGKNPTGKIVLSAFTQDDSVVIKISDDGNGIDVEKVKAKALERGIIDAAKLERLSHQEVLNLIFEPGFSTADQISDLSGRGVGMDSVRTAIERNGGSLVLDSNFGEGSEVTMVLPLSMTISRVMMFELGEQSFAIPIENVIQTLKVDRARDIRKVKQFDAFILRGETVPILYLKELFDMDASQSRPPIQPVLVVRVGDDVLGLAVDKLQEGQDVIIKPLDGALAAFSIYRGAAIMGDGRVLLVLNTEEVVNHAC